MAEEPQRQLWTGIEHHVIETGQLVYFPYGTTGFDATAQCAQHTGHAVGQPSRSTDHAGHPCLCATAPNISPTAEVGGRVSGVQA